MAFHGICQTKSGFTFNPLYIGKLFHCYMLDKSICHFSGVGSILLLLFFLWKILLANNVDPDQMPHNVAANTADPDQMPHYVASDLGLQCLPMTLI